MPTATLTAREPLQAIHHIDKRWFQDRLADRQISQRKFAKLIEVDPAAVSLTLDGKRLMKMTEAVAFASLTGVPLDDVLVRAGIRPPGLTGKGSCPLVGYIDATGAVRRGQVDAPRRAIAPPEMPAGCAVLRYKTTVSAAELIDGWLVYFSDDVRRVAGDAIGRLCIVGLANHAGERIGFVRRGYERGTYSLTSWIPNVAPLENVLLERASPVLWIRTG